MYKVADLGLAEFGRKEIRLAQEAGFNMIRPWRRPPAPMWLDLADEMGVLVVGSPALECMALPLSTPYLPVRVENEIRELVGECVKYSVDPGDYEGTISSAYSLADEEKFKEMKDHGADVCFSKPLPLPQLKEEVARLLELK